VTHAEIMPVDPLHIREICTNLRDIEFRNFRVLGRDAEAMISYEVATSFLCYAAVVEGEVIALGGVKCDSVLSDEAYVWILCSEAVNEFPIAFIRGVLEVFALVKERFRTIWGLVSEDFARSRRWLSWMGFTVEAPKDGVCLFWYGTRPVRH
jgi:hypothetical protein